MLFDTQNSVTRKHGKRFEDIKTGMADRWALVQAKKIYQPSGMWDKLSRTAWLRDFICPIFWKFEIFGQVGCRTCDMGPYKWLYRHL